MDIFLVHHNHNRIYYSGADFFGALDQYKKMTTRRHILENYLVTTLIMTSPVYIPNGDVEFLLINPNI